MTDGRALTVSAAFDRGLIWRRGDSVRHLVVNVSAAPSTADALDAPLNIALVIDVSRSMRGARLQAAVRAVSEALDQLGPHDIVSLISFAGDVRVHLAGEQLDGSGRRLVAEALASVGTRAGSDVGRGWVQGAECVAEVQERYPAYRHQVILLSDGRPTAGERDPEVLAQHAHQIGTWGIGTSTIGIGDRYDLDLLLRLADAGGGRMHAAAEGEDLPSVLTGELAQLRGTVAENVEVEVELPHRVRAAWLSGTAAPDSRGRIAVGLGSLGHDRARLVVLRVTAPAGPVGDVLAFTTKVRWGRPGPDAWNECRVPPARLTFAPGSQNSAQPRDDRASLAAAHAWQSRAIREAVRLNRRAAFDEAWRYLNAELHYFTRYCRDLPVGDRLIAEVEQVRDRIMQPWSERSRNEIELAHIQRQRGQSDPRTNRCQDWTTALP